MKAIIFDTETTGIDDPELIEAAWLELGQSVKDLNPLSDFHCRYKPSKPISMGAMATHHIMDEDLVDCPASSDFKLPDVEYLVGHNIDFDWQVIGKPDVKRICTLALARKCWTQLDSHSQSALLYHLDRVNARARLRDAHSAAADIRICLTILDKLRRVYGPESWEELYQMSESASIPDVITFGKHKGTKFSEVPYDYIYWALRQDFDEYIRRAFELELERRTQK